MSGEGKLWSERGVGSQQKDSPISKMFWLSFAAMFAMARAPHCCPSSVPLVSIAVRPDSWVWGSMISELKIPRGAGREIVLYLPERAPGLMAMVCAFCSRHDRLLRASVAKILLFSSVAWSTRSTRPQMVDLPWRLRPPTSAWLC